MSVQAAGNKTVCTFFGSTGGCMNAALVLALQNGNPCAALARTPEKLTKMLLNAGVPQRKIDANLHIVKGDVQDAEAVKQALTHAGGADMILSGIGPNPLSLHPDLTICQKAMRNILSVLHDLNPDKKPSFGVISTTGITHGTNDVPVMMKPLYHAILKKPHEDKKAMEALLVEEVERSDSAVGSYTLVRPTLLFDSKPKGMEGLKVGTEDQPALGYSVSRRDVGRWIYEELIIGDEKIWRNQKVSLTN